MLGLVIKTQSIKQRYMKIPMIPKAIRFSWIFNFKKAMFQIKSVKHTIYGNHQFRNSYLQNTPCHCRVKILKKIQNRSSSAKVENRSKYENTFFLQCRLIATLQFYYLGCICIYSILLEQQLAIPVITVIIILLTKPACKNCNGSISNEVPIIPLIKAARVVMLDSIFD